MTIKQLYDFAVKTGHDNVPIILNYNCNDDWYNYREPIEKNDIELHGDKIMITIYNY